MLVDITLLNSNFNLLFRECTKSGRQFVLASKFFSGVENFLVVGT